ncbi:nucleophosmin 1 [Babesia microti strain RI]|uniref:Nucleophosmin 1 n=1 Tax=Babesia microti (strain RI) TaxID=1133968 RepID=I7J870_BABMR|nr:nucleophosmin 1 [Babesia microti strain RI]CCF75208.2 nucleophosmin 1 [Babesia microti strain RI]|eukprot:XP_021337163.1 nucleophosmin 1 [Babesia microti strain RI]
MLYGAIIEPGKSVTPKNELSSVVHISQLCLDEPSENGKTYVQINDGETLFNLCVLEKDVNEMATVDVFFSTNSISLTTKGAKNNVHVVGYFEPDEAGGLISDSDEFEDEEDDEAEVDQDDDDDDDFDEGSEDEEKSSKRKGGKGKNDKNPKKHKVEDDYEKSLCDYLKKNGKTTLALLGSKVKKPVGLNVKIGQFLKERSNIFKVNGDSVSLV